MHGCAQAHGGQATRYGGEEFALMLPVGSIAASQAVRQELLSNAKLDEAADLVQYEVKENGCNR